MNSLERIARILLFLLLLGAWQILALQTNFRFLFASPADVLRAIAEGTLSGSLPHHSWVTLTEVVAGFLLGVSGGTVLGFVLWLSPLTSRVVRPYVMFLGAIPVFAFAPMVIVWFGIDFRMKVAVVTLATFLVSLEQSFRGAASVDQEQQMLLRSLRAHRRQILRFCILPSSLDWVFASMRMNVSVAFLGAFVAEFISSEEGLGHEMVRSGSLYDTPALIAAGLYLGALASAVHWILGRLEKKRLLVIGALSVSRATRREIAKRRDLRLNK